MGPSGQGTGQARHHRLGQTGGMKCQGRLSGSSPGQASQPQLGQRMPSAVGSSVGSSGRVSRPRRLLDRRSPAGFGVGDLGWPSGKGRRPCHNLGPRSAKWQGQETLPQLGTFGRPSGKVRRPCHNLVLIARTGSSARSPDPAVCWTVGLPPGLGLETFGRQVARSGDLAKGQVARSGDLATTWSLVRPSGKVRRPCHNLVLGPAKWQGQETLPQLGLDCENSGKLFPARSLAGQVQARPRNRN